MPAICRRTIRMMFLGAMQQHLAELYGLEIEYDVYDFLITDRRLARALGGSSRDVDEELLILEADDRAEVSLFVEQAVMDRLEGNDPVDGLNAGNIADFWTAFEGVSHFTYFAFKAALDRSVSLLELELQAEVDKFIVTTLMCRERRQGASHALHQLLFDVPRLGDGLSGQEQERYRQANRYAGRYCRRLWPALKRSSWTEELKRELRRFYRLAREDKMGHIESSG